MTNGFYGNIGEEDEAWAWQSIVRQTAQGVAEDLTGKENTHGEEKAAKTVAEEFSRNNIWLDWLSDSGFFCPLTIPSYVISAIHG